LLQFQKQPLAKVGLTFPPQSTPWWRPWLSPLIGARFLVRVTMSKKSVIGFVRCTRSWRWLEHGLIPTSQKVASTWLIRWLLPSTFFRRTTVLWSKRLLRRLQSALLLATFMFIFGARRNFLSISMWNENRRQKSDGLWTVCHAP